MKNLIMKTPKVLKHLDKESICYDAFIKINRSKLVNLAFISRTLVNDNIYSVQLANGEEIPIARRRLNKIRDEYPMMF